MLSQTPKKTQGNPRLAVLNRDDASTRPGRRHAGEESMLQPHAWGQPLGRRDPRRPRPPELHCGRSGFPPAGANQPGGAVQRLKLPGRAGGDDPGVGDRPGNRGQGGSIHASRPRQNGTHPPRPIVLGHRGFRAHTQRPAAGAGHDPPDDLRAGDRGIWVRGAARPGKWRLMAEVSSEMADMSIFTAEDPRSESLAEILEEMARGATAKGGVVAAWSCSSSPSPGSWWAAASFPRSWAPSFAWSARVSTHR